MIIPPFLQSGDLISLVAPARKVTVAEMSAAVKILKDKGFSVLEGEHLYKEQNQFSGTDAERVQDLQSALDDPSVKAILCARGGYGALRIIDKLDFTKFKSNPKWLIGFSDITVLHSHILSQTGISTIHGPMAINFPQSENATGALLDLLTGVVREFPDAKNRDRNIPGECKGVVTGGNLSILYAMAGSNSMPDSIGKIIFLEDLDEYLYHIDRMILGLKRARFFNGCAGVMVGGMTDMRDNSIPFGTEAELIVREHLEDLNIPVGFGFHAGHLSENFPIVLGAEAEMKVKDNLATFAYSSSPLKSR